MFDLSAECTQLELLRKDHLPDLLRESLPPNWINGDKVQWHPDDETRNQPPQKWLLFLWNYLREHFTTEEELCQLQNLPLIPLDFKKLPVTLTKLKKPSKVVVRRLGSAVLDQTLCKVLTRLGVLVMEDFPDFLKNHPAILGTFVQPPYVSGILQAMKVSSFEMGEGMHSAILLEKVTDNEKRSLRKFIAKTPSLSSEEKNTLLCLPIFETFGNSREFVSKGQGLQAAPADAGEFPVSPKMPFIDIKDEDSSRMARLLDITILNTTDFLLEGIFPHVQNQAYLDEEIDRLMAFVIKRYDVYVGDRTRFEAEMKALRFVPTGGGRVTALDLFDPRNELLRDILAEEDVFPFGEQYNKSSVLAVLEKLGMKSEEKITAQELYQSATRIPEVSSMHAERKSQAVMAYLERQPRRLRETVNGTALGDLLREIPWVCIMRQKPDHFPSSLPFWGEVNSKNKFFRPTDVKSAQKVNLIGTVKPIAETESSSPLASYFGWNENPHAFDVVKHLSVVVNCYKQDEKSLYMEIVQDTYSFLTDADHADVSKAFQGMENSSWIWNGDGFSAPSVMLAEKPSPDLSPYISFLPTETRKYRDLFLKFGMEAKCEASVLRRVLWLIKEKYDRPDHRAEASDVESDLQLSVSILNKLQSNGDELSLQFKEEVLIPTYVKEDAFVRLAQPEECMYCEREWLQSESDNEDTAHFLVHPYVYNSTAEFFGVRTLSNSMLDPDELEVGEQFGQEEKLTCRLNKLLLEDYTDGFAVPKELIQNADDAGATEVSFLYDERTNEDAMTCLIDEGMRECQGAALWVYNDAEFRNEDFENLTKLNGATKEQDTDKIGRFGLGFNAVYNLTDVPMLVSRNYFVVFDPNTFYLGKQIRNVSKPGIKIDTNKNVKDLRKFRNQFKPFNGIFGCDLRLDKDDNSFQGTLFRFPLRTKGQAIRSEIKQLPYDFKQMKELLRLFIRGARSLLLFTQNVRSVSIFHLPKDSSEQPQPKLIFEVTKELSKNGILRELSVPFTLSTAAQNLGIEEQFFLKQCNFLKASSEVATCASDSNTSSTAFLRSALQLNVKSTVTEAGNRFFEDEIHSQSVVETWLVASSMGTGEAMKFSIQNKAKSLVPSAGVAVQLTNHNAPISIPVCQSTDTGTLFCYLPLPIHSGLPVHVNGAFAVTSNRRNLKEKSEDDKPSFDSGWNDVLLRDCVCSAYLDLVEDVKPATEAPGNTYQFHSLWPKYCEVQKACEPLVRSFYGRLVTRSLPLFASGCRWVGIHDVCFLHPKFRLDDLIGDIAFEVFQALASGSKAVVDLPADVCESFEKCGLAAKIQPGCYDEVRFYRELFFPKIASVPPQLRNNLVLYALDDKSEKFDGFLAAYACIPVSPFGKTLKLPRELVSPKREARLLFCPEDERFPHGSQETFLNRTRLFKLERLGMLTDDICWPDVAERAESICILNKNDSDAAVERSENLIGYLEKKLKRSGQYIESQVQTRILRAKFIPVQKKPQSFPLTWMGDQLQDGSNQVLVSPADVYLREHLYLVCCSEAIVNVSMPPKVKDFLKLNRNQPTVKHAINQLNEAVSTSLGIAGSDEIRKVCIESYKFLEGALKKNETKIVDCLKGKRFILVGDEFLCPRQIAFKLNADCPPFLYKVPEELARLCSTLLKATGVRDVFEAEDFINALERIKERFEGRKLDKRTLAVAVTLSTQLEDSLVESKSCITTDKKRESIYLPNSNGVMKLVKELCFQDCSWISGETGIQFVYSKIPQSTGVALGVKTRREEALRRHALGISFGQREKLTNRLKRILKAYPCGNELLKELLQNADDAQATEICFILDPRSHPKERIFETCWEPLQGPALCVYNNKPFTKSDLEGIQNLGEGSKGDDPSKTGQYGVGFNAVYHLTDVPSFMSKGDEIGDVLCVFDPHCRYVPDANPQEPGRMYADTAKLKETFPDVFSCYLGEHFTLEDSTMFRFPLRTQEMAETSKLSKVPVKLKDVRGMMEALKSELFEVLLFVNNVKKITLCDIDDNGQVANSYCVEALISEQDARKRLQFASYIKKIGKLVREGESLPFNDGSKQCSYFMTLCDNVGNEENWFIVQKFGFENSVAKSIPEAVRRQDLALLPLGGVACLLKKEPKRRAAVERKKKAYCFLPLPVKTDLPVHINGHFALGHEARRDLWRDETGGYRSDWNNSLLADVIASCYLTLLDEVRSCYQPPVLQSPDPGRSSCNENDLIRRLQDYEKLFPTFSSKDSPWNPLVKSVYLGMNNKQLPLLPVVRSSTRRHEAELKWFPPTGTGNDQAFFNNLEAEETRERRRTKRKISSVAEILVQAGFNLVNFSLSVFHNLVQSGVNARCVSPASVVDFLKTFSSQDSFCRIGPLPVVVSETPFRNEIGVSLLLAYCKDQEQFCTHLSGLPLLLTQDNILRVFDLEDPKFLSDYYDILPHCQEMFVHERLKRDIFQGGASDDAPVFQPFDVKAFSRNLPKALPPLYHGEDYVSWSPDKKTEPSRHWISRVWSFLQEVVDTSQSYSEPSCTLEVLAPLSSWSILPATEPLDNFLNVSSPVADDFLVPLKLAESVLDFTNIEATLACSRPLGRALRSLGLPELNCTTLPSSPQYMNLPRCIVASPLKPVSLLTALHSRMMRKPRSLQGKLDRSGCKTILKYFCDNLNSLESMPSSKDILRKLPFYLTTHGGLVAIDDQRSVCLLPSGIPRIEMNQLESEVKVLFLECMQDLSNLYKYLSFDSISSVNVYCEFILPNFNVFSREARETHLKYIRDSVFTSTLLNDHDEQRLTDCLKNKEVITTKNGTLRKANSFHDPRNDVFKAMLSGDKFPSEPFNSDWWLLFMKKIGMVCEVSCDHFKRFTAEVAHEAVTQRTDTTDKKSKVLVSHLFSRSQVLSEGLLQAVCGVRFVVSDPVREDLLNLHAQFGEREDGKTPYISFKGSVVSDHAEAVWTTAYLLPKWADPSFHFGRAFYLPQLYVLSNPTLELVTAHCIRISHHLAKQNDTKVPEEQIATRRSVMRKIYTLLQDKVITESNVKGGLESAPCVLVEKGTRLVQAKQVVLELLERDEISPFLFRVPPEFGEFHQLFHHLGCSKSVQSSHYAMVLEMLHDQCQENKLHPNEIQSSMRAVRGLFESLLKDSEKNVELLKLYLPALCPHSRSPSGTSEVTLHKSTDLIFDDAPQYQSRLQHFKQLFLVDLKRAELQFTSSMNYKDYIMRLPTDCRPKVLSDVVEEKFVDNQDSIGRGSSPVQLSVADSLTKQLGSQQFCHAILRLIRHANHESGNLDDTVIASVKERLKNIEFLGMNRIETKLMYEGIPIPGSETEVPLFVDKVSKAGKVLWKVYIVAEEDATLGNISLALTEVISEACEGLLRHTVMFIPEMLRADPTEIWSILDTMKIRQDDSYDASQSNVLPQPGNFIPIEDHHLLNEAFEEFTPGEYVALELDDPSLSEENGDATFIYAIIIEETNCEGATVYTKLYTVNIGHDKRVAESADLYKFHRFQFCEEAGSSSQTKDKTKILAQITEVLEMAWQLPEERRRKIVKRLFLQWHPDKTLEDQAFCQDVFQHLQDELARLESNKARRTRRKGSGSTKPNHYEAFFHFWGTRARRHQAQRQEYKAIYLERFGSREVTSALHGSTTVIPPSFCKKNPQPGEARRWFRQARADLKAADKDLAADNPSYEWACFKCHQVSKLPLNLHLPKLVTGPLPRVRIDDWKENGLNVIECLRDRIPFEYQESWLDGLLELSLRECLLKNIFALSKIV